MILRTIWIEESDGWHPADVWGEAQLEDNYEIYQQRIRALRKSMGDGKVREIDVEVDEDDIAEALAPPLVKGRMQMLHTLTELAEEFGVSRHVLEWIVRTRPEGQK